MKIRINKYLAEQGICSRRQADEHILANLVSVNGKIAKPGDMIDPEIDIVKLQGKEISSAAPENEYWVLNKPLGVVTTASDEKKRKTVVDFVKSHLRLYPIGRLDINTCGLIILTNDGELTNMLTHPSFKNIKRYRLIARKLRSISDAEIMKKFERGFRIDGKVMRADRVVNIYHSDQNNYLEIDLELITGYNRQIRRMCDKIGLEVKKLTRTGMGKLNLDSLKLEPGQAIRISRSDII